MATLKEIADAHGTGTIHMPSGTIENEADYNAKVTVEGVTKLSWSALQTEIGKVAYIGKRQDAYPMLSEQLDMLFRDIAANKVTTDGELYKALAKVKSDNEKP
tara:strand:+ start:807 stop:1115 length:309 start_codon:yes stop_codon:yes gene_type:complete